MAKRNYREKKWNRCDAAELANPAHAVPLCCEQRFRFKAILILDSKVGEERSNNVFLELFKAKSRTSLHKCTPAGDAGREGSSAEATAAPERVTHLGAGLTALPAAVCISEPGPRRSAPSAASGCT